MNEVGQGARWCEAAILPGGGGEDRGRAQEDGEEKEEETKRATTRRWKKNHQNINTTRGQWYTLRYQASSYRLPSKPSSHPLPSSSSYSPLPPPPPPPPTHPILLFPSAASLANSGKSTSSLLMRVTQDVDKPFTVRGEMSFQRASGEAPFWRTNFTLVFRRGVGMKRQRRRRVRSKINLLWLARFTLQSPEWVPETPPTPRWWRLF